MSSRRGRRRATAAPTVANVPLPAEEPEQDEVGELLSRLPADTPPQLIEMISQSMYSGPVPPPAMMQQYEAALPGMADRIMTMAEKEQGMRRRDNGWIMANDTLRIVGSIVVSVGLIAAGVYCGVIGQPWLGGVLGTSGAIAGVASKLVHGKQG